MKVHTPDDFEGGDSVPGSSKREEKLFAHRPETRRFPKVVWNEFDWLLSPLCPKETNRAESYQFVKLPGSIVPSCFGKAMQLPIVRISTVDASSNTNSMMLTSSKS